MRAYWFDSRNHVVAEETETSRYIEIPVPGIPEKDIEAFIESGVLSVKVGGSNTRLWDRLFAAKTVTIDVSQWANGNDSLNATLENGVLRIEFPKVETRKSIPIKCPKSSES